MSETQAKVRPLRVRLVFGGIDLRDDDVADLLSEDPSIRWSARDGLAFAEVTSDASNVVAVALEVSRRTTELVPTAHALRVDEDLVTVSDVAVRLGVSREAVRHWVDSRRGPGGFPPPLGIVGDRQKVWTWAVVNRWLLENLAIGDPYDYASPSDVAELNARFAGRSVFIAVDGLRVKEMVALARKLLADSAGTLWYPAAEQPRPDDASPMNVDDFALAA